VSQPTTILVIGAGIAGLAAASELSSAGPGVVIVDKSRAVGGRMATKRALGTRFDIGAQHFGARGRLFTETVGSWVERDLAKVWFTTHSVDRPDRGVEPRYAGVGSMRSICEAMAAPFDVRLGVRVSRLRVDRGRVVAESDNGTFEADGAIVTPPLPQALAILGEIADPVAPDLRRVGYEPCLAAMFRLDDSSGLADGHLSLSSGSVAWVADNEHKGVADEPAITVHSSPDFARAHFDEPPELWLSLLREHVQTLIQPRITSGQGHRWRYAMPVFTRSDGALLVHRAPPVVLAGDGIAGPRVEAAFLSGVTAGGIIRAL
jgi:predicted NAD/FAD-dependent oxidoreductase